MNKYFIYTSLIIKSIIFIFLIIKILKPFVRHYVNYMFNEKTGWNKQIDRPKLLFHQIGLLMIIFSSYFYVNISSLGQIAFIVNSIASWLLFITGSIVCFLTWTDWFKSKFIPRTKAKLKQKNNFNLSISKIQLNKLYDELVKYDLINSSKTSSKDFINVLLEDWDNHNSCIYFTKSFDNPSMREFFELLKEIFPKNNLTLKNFLETSNLIKKENSEDYKYNSVKNSKSRTPVSKKNKELNNIFLSIQT